MITPIRRRQPPMSTEDTRATQAVRPTAAKVRDMRANPHTTKPAPTDRASDKSLGTQSSPNSNAENITIYTWDNSNQMTSATFYNSAADWSAGTITAAGEWTVTYGNDVFGRMVTRTATVTNDDLSQTTTTQNFIYDGQNIVLILDGDGNVIERELTGAAPDQVFASEDASTDVVNWYLTDNQGTVRDVVQSDGTTTTEVDHLVYSAYGQLTDQTAAPDLGERPTFYYNGTWQDAQTGMNKMGLRWADLADAVFASKDPIGFWSGTTNLSEYVGNSPTNFTDPTGMAGKGIEADSSGGVGTEASGCGCVHRPVGTGAISEGTGLGSGTFVTRQGDGGDGTAIGPDDRTWWQRFTGDIWNLWNVPPSDYSGKTAVPDRGDSPAESTTRHFIHYIVYPAIHPHKDIFANSHASDADYNANIAYAGAYLQQNSFIRGGYGFAGGSRPIPRLHVEGEVIGVAGYSIDEGAYGGVIYAGAKEVGPLTVALGGETTCSQSSGWHTEPIVIGDLQLSKKGGVGIYWTPGADESGAFLYSGNSHKFTGGGVTFKTSRLPNLIDSRYWNGTLPVRER